MDSPALKIDWYSDDNHLLLNPRMPAEQRHALERAFERAGSTASFLAGEPMAGHIALQTSGSTGKGGAEFGVLVLLSKRAFLASAVAVNEAFDATSADAWLNPLPIFHVGGLSVYARASASRARVHEFAEGWGANEYAERVEATNATLTSLVPTQLFDLVRARRAAPRSLRAVFVGGGALQRPVFLAARQLGWPVLPSYGLTECASQVATARLSDLHASEAAPPLHILPHVTARTDEQGRLYLRSRALLTGIIRVSSKGEVFEDPTQDGWLPTEDRALLTGDVLEPLGRGQDFVKIGGESVSLARLEALLADLRFELGPSVGDAALIAVPDERLGSTLHLLVANAAAHDVALLTQAYNKRVLPFERIRATHAREKIPRSPLGKLLRQEALCGIDTGSGEATTSGPR